jgi:twitching motility protein PilT
VVTQFTVPAEGMCENPVGAMQLNALLRLMTDKSASDLHLKPMRPPLLRIHGRLMPIEADPLPPTEIEEMVLAILTPAQKAHLEENMALDLGHGVPGLARFRGNIYRQRGTLAAAFRRIPYEIRGLEELELPESLGDLCDLPMGLVLVTGPTGSGKSTTLAALVRKIARERSVHLITIEDPIEYLFADEVASISQREIGTDTRDFALALRNAMRQDPDVIMVGEMRDPETVGTVITAAETGHLVFSTLHTNSATQTVDRILDNFPSQQQKQIRQQLAQTLKGVISMQLVERSDGEGRIAALEILRATPRVSQLIEAGETASLHDEVENSVAYHKMQSMNQSLLALLAHGTISYQEAMRQSPEPEDLSLQLRRMFPGIEERGGDMSPSPADFSQIMELQQYRKLYEEQEEKSKLQLSELEGQMAALGEDLRERDQRIQQLNAQIQEVTEKGEKMRAEYRRLRREAQEKIDKLGERIKELNQRLLQNS